MKKRERPPMPPLFEQIQAAARQLLGMENTAAKEFALDSRKRRIMGETLDALLSAFAAQVGCPIERIRCDHEPALRVRAYNPRIKDVAARYKPHAHDPGHLRFRPHDPELDGSHHVKTYVRGDHGQFCDAALIKRERRREKAKASGVRRRKRKWSGGKMPAKANQWPKGRKIPGRKKS